MLLPDLRTSLVALAVGLAAGAEPEGGPAGARLSAEASEFLLEFARDAEYAGTCRARGSRD